MDFYTKAFLINLVLFVFVCIFDKGLFDDAIEKAFGMTIGIWSLFTMFTVPVWLIYIIINW